jgi:hypothetical protein
MKKTIRLTESDLIKLVKQIIKESDQGDILSCLSKATNMSSKELIKLAPCLELQKNPTDKTNIESCVSAVIPFAQEKFGIDFSDPMGSAKKIMDLTTKCLACVGNVSPVMY